MSSDHHAWIEQLVDGQPLDWSALERALGTGSPALARMRRMAVLCAALTAGQPVRSATPEPCLFRWGHLDVRAPIGRGSSGQVYRAFDTVLERDVALKLIGSESLQARAFIAEARRLAQVRHANVLAVHGAAVHDGRAGLWSELIAGRSLADWVRDEGSRPPAQILDVARSLAAALAAVHAAGLVHGDVKPANVMREDDSGRIVLMDFGSADARAGAGRHGLLGSPASMAPEQGRGESVGPAADAYGLGATLYYLATGAYPLAADSPLGAGEFRDVDPAAPTAFGPRTLPSLLRRLLRDLLAASPQARPDMATLCARLARIADAPRRRRRQAAAATVIGSLGLGLALALAGLRSAHEAQQHALAERDRAEAANAFLVDVIAAPQTTREGEQVRVVELLEQAVVRLRAGALAGRANVEADLWQTVGRSFSALDRRDDARDALERAVALRRTLHGSDDPRTLEAERVLALERNADPPSADSLAHWHALHARAVAATDMHHPLPTLIEAAIGSHHLRLGHVQDARAWIEPIYRRRIDVDWLHPLDRSTVEIHWLQLLQHLGDVDAMLQAAGETRRFVEAHAGERHANALIARNIQIGALLQRGRLVEAEREARAAHALALSWLGEENGFTAAALGSLATALTEQGRTQEALPLQEKRVALARQRHGPTSLQVRVAELNLANALRAERDWPRAEALYDAVIAELPERSDVALLARGNLAELYLDQARYARARTIARDALTRLDEALGADHLFTQHARAMAGAAERGLGRPGEALALLEAAVTGIERYLGAEHLLTLKARLHLALTLADLDRGEDARALLRDIADRRRARLGAAHPDTQAAVDALARLTSS